MPLSTPNVRLALVALGCAVLAGCSSDRNGPLAPVTPPQVQAADSSSESLRSGYMLSTGWAQPSPQQDESQDPDQPLPPTLSQQRQP